MMRTSHSSSTEEMAPTHHADLVFPCRLQLFYTRFTTTARMFFCLLLLLLLLLLYAFRLKNVRFFSGPSVA